MTLGKSSFVFAMYSVFPLSILNEKLVYQTIYRRFIYAREWSNWHLHPTVYHAFEKTLLTSTVPLVHACAELLSIYTFFHENPIYYTLFVSHITTTHITFNRRVIFPMRKCNLSQKPGLDYESCAPLHINNLRSVCLYRYVSLDDFSGFLLGRIGLLLWTLAAFPFPLLWLNEKTKYMFNWSKL